MATPHPASLGARATFAGTVASVREFFLLGRARARSAAVALERARPARSVEASGLSQLSGADALWAAGKPGPALHLYREAASLLARALLISVAEGDDEAALAPPELFVALSRVLNSSRDVAPLDAESIPRLRTLLTSSGPELESFAQFGSGSELRKFGEAVHWLAGQLELRTPFEIGLRQAQRVSVALVVLGVLAWGSGATLFHPQNLARHKSVQSSSAAYDTRPSGAVDGIRYGQLGFHSGSEHAPWLVVDLERVTAVREVRVYGRADCCFDQSVPLALETSNDGVTFNEVARRTKPFTQYEPWIVRLATSARFVRLRTHRQSVLVLSELEIY